MINKILSIIFIFIIVNGFCQKDLTARLSIVPHYGPMYHVFEQESNVDFSQDYCFEAGGFLTNKFKLGNNVSLDALFGLNWSNKKYTTFLNYTSSKTSYYTEFTYLNIPIAIHLSLDKMERFKPFLSVGYIFGLLRKEYRLTSYDNGNTTLGFGGDVNNFSEPRYLNFGVGTLIKLNETFSIYLEPNLKYCVRQEGPSQDETIMKSFNLRFGVSINLPKIGFK
jgi:hypothetical protein